MAGQAGLTRLQLPPAAWVAAGSAVGTCARWMVALLLQVPGSHVGLPWSTLAVNVAGSFLIGLYAAFSEPGGRVMASPAQRLFVMVGICGGFTTFSLFTAEVFGCLQRGDWMLAGLLMLASVSAWLIGVATGYVLGKSLNRLP